MTLEQRIEALELAVANIATHQQVTEGTNNTITDELRPGGVLYVAQKKGAGFASKGVLNDLESLIQNALQRNEITLTN